jgi:hypothetical protein
MVHDAKEKYDQLIYQCNSACISFVWFLRMLN